MRPPIKLLVTSCINSLISPELIKAEIRNKARQLITTVMDADLAYKIIRVAARIPFSKWDRFVAKVKEEGKGKISRSLLASAEEGLEKEAP